MRFAAQASLFLLFCCAAQPGFSLSHAESWSWPWSKKKPAEAPALVEPEENSSIAEIDPEQTAEKEGLTVPGCYMRMSSGCPERPMRTEAWRHDAWAEKRRSLDKSECQKRKAVWDKYCNSVDAEMAFVAKKSPDA